MCNMTSNSIEQHWNLIWLQVGVGHFCHLPENWEILFIGKIFTIFEIILWKVIKFLFHCRITHLCSLNMGWGIFKKNSRKSCLCHPVVKGHKNISKSGNYKPRLSRHFLVRANCPLFWFSTIFNACISCALLRALLSKKKKNCLNLRRNHSNHFLLTNFKNMRWLK